MCVCVCVLALACLCVITLCDVQLFFLTELNRVNNTVKTEKYKKLPQMACYCFVICIAINKRRRSIEVTGGIRGATQ